MRTGRSAALAMALLKACPIFAGEIPGMPTALPPFLDSRFEFAFSNDFLGRGGGVDDFRTQQFTFTARPGDRLVVIADHSVLTLKEAGRESRIDQVAGSVGYRLIDDRSPTAANRVTAGIGFRSVGDYGGERMQNGFHRLIAGDVEFLPYSDADDGSATGWIDAERYAVFREAGPSWRFAYWLRGRTLATSDGQFDATVSVAAVASRGGLDIWAGIRQDWRTGYEEPVQSATADQEADAAGVLGIRFGSMIIETVQQFSKGASFGQLRFVSSESSASARATPPSRFGFEAGFLLPDVHLHLQGRLESDLFPRKTPDWQESVFVSFDFGEPQYDGDNTVYVRSKQIGIGLEWERPLSQASRWLAGYASAGIGWRQEQLIGDGPMEGAASSAADSGAVLAGAGLRFYASALGTSWRYRIQLGATAWIPWRDANLTIGARTLSVLRPSLALSVGFTFDFV